MLGFVDGRLKELGIADLLYLPQRALLLKPIDERLHDCVSNAFVLGEALQDLAHRRGAEFPVLLQNAGFGVGKTRLFHDLLLTPAMLLQETAYGHDSSWDPAKTSLCFGTAKRSCDHKSSQFVYCRLAGRYPDSTVRLLLRSRHLIRKSSTDEM